MAFSWNRPPKVSNQSLGHDRPDALATRDLSVKGVVEQTHHEKLSHIAHGPAEQLWRRTLHQPQQHQPNGLAQDKLSPFIQKDARGTTARTKNVHPATWARKCTQSPATETTPLWPPLGGAHHVEVVPSPHM